MTCPVTPPDLTVLDIPGLAASFPRLLAAAVNAMPCTAAPRFFSATATAEGDRRSRGRQDVLAAQQLCRRCPLREPCAAYAVQHHERGVWGGTTESDRRLFRRDRRGAPPGLHGTSTGSMPRRG